ncbi:MAG: hypothetical protein FJ161_03420 [Gammaproteobacteria bacterium]|nr:hypothetical protein [Gammaproteobacteria bacterium]
MRNLSLVELACVDGQGPDERNFRAGWTTVMGLDVPYFMPTCKGAEDMVKDSCKVLGVVSGLAAIVSASGDARKNGTVPFKTLGLSVVAACGYAGAQGAAVDTVRNVYSYMQWPMS